MEKHTVEKNNRKAVLRRKVIKSILGDDNNENKSNPEITPKKKSVALDDKVFTAICDELADGITVEAACMKMGVNYRTFRRFIEKGDEKIGQLYARAREWRGEACLMKIDDIMHKLETGQIDSSTANVLINTEKWKASKFYPKMYSDTVRTQMIDDSGKGINPFESIYKAICDNKDYTPAK